MYTYDISLTIHPGMPVWPGDPRIILERISKMEEGAMNNLTRIDMTVHAGTHVDAPYHFLGRNTPTVDMLPLSLLTGRAYVLELSDKVDLITAPILERAGIPPRLRRLLIKTRNSAFWKVPDQEFRTDFVAISADGAQYLVDRGIKLVGIDYLSVAPFDQPVPTHQILLQAGVVIVEGLDLSEVSQGRYALFCLPLKLAGVDGAPARVILVGV